VSMNRFKKYLANNMKTARKEKNLTQMQLAELCDTSLNYIGLIETEKRFPSAEMLEKIAKALDLEPQDMFAESINNSSLIIKELLEKIGEMMEKKK